MKVRWDVSKLKNAVEHSECLSDVCKYMGLDRRGKAYDGIRAEIKRQNLDINHFKNLSQLMRERYINNRVRSKDEIFKENSLASSNTVKRYIIKHKLLICVCAICNLFPEWQGKTLVLQLDHINGISDDHRLENLRWLCPNCHTQTDTYAGKKSKLPKKSELNPFWRNQPKFITRKVTRPSKEELKSLIEKYNWSELGRQFGVSDNAVRKWAKSYNLI